MITGKKKRENYVFDPITKWYGRSNFTEQI